MRIQNFLILFLTAIISVGCGSILPTPSESNALDVTEPAEPQQQLPAPTASLPTPPTSNGEIIAMTPTSSASGLQKLIEKAVEDLAQRLSVAASEISLIEASEVVWPDASLGCPQPNMLYKQVPSDGARIILKAQSITYEYHSGGERGLFLCEKASVKTEKPPQIDITTLTPQNPAAKKTPPTIPDNTIPPGEDK